MSRAPLPNFARRGGLISAIAQDAESGEVLMLGFMNEAAWRETLACGEAVYWSTSRNCLWRKGESSGNTQRVLALFVDCDGDAVLLKVEQRGGAACHTGRRSCFYRARALEEGGAWRDVGVQVFDPKEVYGK